jgi:hypothetical protein
MSLHDSSSVLTLAQRSTDALAIPRVLAVAVQEGT